MTDGNLPGAPIPIELALPEGKMGLFIEPDDNSANPYIPRDLSIQSCRVIAGKGVYFHRDPFRDRLLLVLKRGAEVSAYHLLTGHEAAVPNGASLMFTRALEILAGLVQPEATAILDSRVTKELAARAAQAALDAEGANE